MARVIEAPDDLTERDQWVLWRYYERSPGDVTKVPFQTSGAKAKANDPSTWTTYKDAHTAYLESVYDGIGFVFTAGDSFVGIDLDDCLDDRGDLKPGWQLVVEAFADTYIERSPSGTGLKIFAKGTIERPCNFPYQDGAIEIYAQDRFFTVTGVAWNGPPRRLKNLKLQLTT